MGELINRRRIEEINRDADQAWLGKAQAEGVVVVQTATKILYPAVAGAYFWCEILRVTGNPVEGGAVSFKGTGQHIIAYNLGPTLPPLGTKKIARLANGRWFINHG